MAEEGWDLVLKLVKYNQPDADLEDIKHALPTVEAMAVFFGILFDEYQPEVMEDPLPKKAPAGKPKQTTRTTGKGKTSKPKKSQ